MSEDCLFCKIVNSELPADKVFENEVVIGFKDISPAAPIHILFINKKHTENIEDLSKTPNDLVDLFNAVTEYAKSNSKLDGGYRLIINKGKDGGQTVFHTHVHLLGGKQQTGL
jgi:histidine triad (HIT) family protein